MFNDEKTKTLKTICFLTNNLKNHLSTDQSKSDLETRLEIWSEQKAK